jgi:glycopeptide antibiotics resistance protein
MIHQLAKPGLILLAIVLFFWIFFRLVLATKQTSYKTELLVLLFVAYIVCVLIITLYPLPMTRVKIAGVKGINFKPVVNTMAEFSENAAKGRSFMRSHTFQNLFGNILLFVPLGILLPLISSRLNSFVKVFSVALFFSASIEVLQFFSREMRIYRSVDIDDVILNVIGAVGGFLIVRLLYKNNRVQ